MTTILLTKHATNFGVLETPPLVIMKYQGSVVTRASTMTLISAITVVLSVEFRAIHVVACILIK